MAKSSKTFDLRSGLRAGAMVAMLERIMRIELSALLAPLGMTYPQFSALMALYHSGPVSSADLARIMMMTRQSSNEMIRHMEATGWIVRKPDPGHKKRRLISITPKGEDALQKADSAAMSVEQRMLSKHSEREQARLLQQLQVCMTALGVTDLSAKKD